MIATKISKLASSRPCSSGVRKGRFLHERFGAKLSESLVAACRRVNRPFPFGVLVFAKREIGSSNVSLLDRIASDVLLHLSARRSFHFGCDGPQASSPRTSFMSIDRP